MWATSLCPCGWEVCLVDVFRLLITTRIFVTRQCVKAVWACMRCRDVSSIARIFGEALYVTSFSPMTVWTNVLGLLTALSSSSSRH